jgi:hypothetical protein
MTQPDHTPAAPHVDDNQLIAERRAKLAALRQRPTDAAIAAAIARSAADIAALERELDRHPAKTLR